MSLRSTTISDGGREIRRRLVAAATGFVLLVALLAIARAFDRSTVVDGPAGSSFVTTPQGTAALFETLDRLGAEPVRLRRPVLPEALAGADSYAVLDPGLSTFGDVESTVLRRFAEEGGTVVVAGLPPSDLALVEDPPTWSALRTIPEARVELPGLDRVRAGRFGGFVEAGGGTPLLTSERGLLGVAYPLGRGRVVYVADVAVFSNENLDELDNAELAVELLGTGRVVFDEYRHGYSEAGPSGLVTSLPGRWNAVATLLLVVTMVALVTYGRRLGPPEPIERDLGPDRKAFLESVARMLRRAGDPVAATAPVRAAVRARVAARARLPADAGAEEMRAAARMAGLDEEEIDAIFTPLPDSVLAADRALARLARTPADEEAP